jgi:4-amino-4-deoxy-L-arabinose transferase-like glycosyltransferase
MTRRHLGWGLAGVLALYLALGAAYSVTTPVFEAPDESHHFFVVKHIVDYRALPVQRAETRGLWEQEGSQPPLYYAVGALLVGGIDLSDTEDLLWRNPQANIGDPTNPGNKNLYVHPPDQRFSWRGAVLATHVLRFLSLALGAGTVAGAWHIVRLVFPREPVLALATAAVTAFVPQFLFITSAVNNDNAITCLGTLSLYLFLRMLRDGTSDGLARGVSAGRWAMLGAVLGLALLSKLSALALLILAGVVIALVAWHGRSWQVAWRASLWVGLPVVLLAGWWYVRNVLLYGEPTGLTAMWEVVGRRDDFGQGLWGEFRGLRYSFWGLFGWFSIAMSGWVYRILDVFSLVAVAGLCIGGVRWGSLGLWRGAWSAFRYREPGWGAAFPPLALGLMWFWLGMTFVSLVRWTSLTHGTQGRLLFAALVPFALAFVLGLRVWFLPRVRDAATAVICAGLFLLAVLAPWAWIAPSYAYPRQIEALPDRAIPLDLAYGEATVLRGIGLPQEYVRAGDSLEVDLYWEADRPMPDASGALTALRLSDPLGDFVGVEDSYPGAGMLPMSLWPADQLLAGRQYVRVGRDVDAPLIARLSISVYDSHSGEHLGMSGDREPIVGRIKIVPRSWPRIGRREVVAWLDREKPPDSGKASGVVLARAEWPERLSLGQTLPVKLVWAVRSAPGRDYTVFVHLVDGAGNVCGYGDGPPRYGRYPTWIWSKGEVIEDEHSVSTGSTVPPGHYSIKVGLYDAGGRVPAYRADGSRWLHDAVELGTAEVY